MGDSGEAFVTRLESAHRRDYEKIGADCLRVVIADVADAAGGPGHFHHGPCASEVRDGRDQDVEPRAGGWSSILASSLGLLTPF